MFPLTVYKASAGSGKTFTLASQYIRLLVENPQQYRNILAVTFTNKATEEMKMRILSQLYGIWKRLPDSDDYTKKICEQLDYPPEKVSKLAGIALKNLLHHYSYFRVSTIDTFFQSVLRNLARELELTANLRVELNDTQVEEQAVDSLIDDLKTTDQLLQWILKYVMDNIDDDHSWNVIGSIKHFGNTIFKDFYKQHSEVLAEKLTEKGFFEHYTQQLHAQMKMALECLEQVGNCFSQAMEAEGLCATDIKNGKNIVNFFERLKNGIIDDSIVTKTVKDYSQNAECWCKKGTEGTLMPVVEDKLMPLLNNALEERRRQYSRWQSAQLTLKHLNQLRLLGKIEERVHLMNSDANRFLLSDTQQLLHELIDNSDSPFIFEKIGAQLKHIMIDEFQDTSTIQWQNFKVLLEECMSHEDTQNLIVGDVKQSIYRWRSGDWRLLNNIESAFPMPGKQLKIKTLETNYRSQRNIIDFNNVFFKHATQNEYKELCEKVGEQMAEQIQKAYADVRQEIPSNRDETGKISISLLPADDYRHQVLSQTCETIRELLSAGAQPSDIAILIRAKDVIPDIIDYFAANMPEVDIISDEAFRLDASLAVRTIIHAMHLLLHPDDSIVKATLVKVSSLEVVDGLLTQGDELLRMPLFELAEQLHRLFCLQRWKEENAYLCAFYDYLNKYVADNAADLETFLRYWSETLCSKTIQSNVMNGIRLLTIHKSKGLEFLHVVLPFCDWKLERVQKNIIWCHTEEMPYGQLPLIPIDYSGKLAGTVFEQAYFDEFLQNRVDNLNLLYVAFTRARNNLFVIGRRNASATRSDLMEKILPNIQQELKGSILLTDEDKQKAICFDYGTLCMKQKELQQSENVLIQPHTLCKVEIKSYDNKTCFRQSNKSRDFIESNDEEVSSNQYIKLGSVLHDIFSHIRTADDIDSVLSRMQMDGILYDANLTYERTQKMLHKWLSNGRIQYWFSDRWQLFNECTILSVNPDDGSVIERRPDRVMTDGKEMIVLDFKFGKPKPAYHEQVREYMDLLQQMGYQNVRGFLWYVYNNKIEEV